MLAFLGSFKTLTAFLDVGRVMEDFCVTPTKSHPRHDQVVASQESSLLSQRVYPMIRRWY